MRVVPNKSQSHLSAVRLSDYSIGTIAASPRRRRRRAESNKLYDTLLDILHCCAAAARGRCSRFWSGRFLSVRPFLRAACFLSASLIRVRYQFYDHINYKGTRLRNAVKGGQRRGPCPTPLREKPAGPCRGPRRHCIKITTTISAYWVGSSVLWVM